MSDFLKSKKVKGKANTIVVSSRKYLLLIITKKKKIERLRNLS